MSMTDDNLKKQLSYLTTSGHTVKAASEMLRLSYSRAYNILTGRTKAEKTPRSDAGRSRSGIYEQLLPIAKEMYINQGKQQNLQDVIHRVYDSSLRNGIELTEATLGRHVRAAAESENWGVLWMYRNDKPAFNQILPKNQYDRMEWPFMGFHLMDNRTADIWVYSEEYGRLIRPYQYFIVEARTLRVLGYAIKQAPFSRLDVSRLRASTIAKWGAPLYAYICDNGSEQISGDSVQAMECVFDMEYRQACRIPYAVPELHSIFPEAISPIITSIPRHPQFSGKGSIERIYAGEHRYDARIAGNGYSGTGRGDQVSPTHTRSPRLDSTTWTFREYEQYTHWRFNADADERFHGLIPYMGEHHPEAFRRFSEATGLPPTVGAAWQHASEGFEFAQIPDERILQLFMNTEVHFKDKLVDKINQVKFRHNNVTYCFSEPGLTYRLYRKRVDVVLDPNDDTRALILFEGQPVGIAADLNRKRLRPDGMTIGESRHWQRLNRNTAKEELRQAISEIAPKRKAPVPDVIPEHMAESPFALAGMSHGELIEAAIQKRLDASTEPELEIDKDILARQARISQLSTNQK